MRCDAIAIARYILGKVESDVCAGLGFWWGESTWVLFRRRMRGHVGDESIAEST
jgi:hypothetical protein